MIRRLFIVAVSLAALTACTTYNSGYRNYSPAQAGYGDYYYAPDPGPSYYAPGYLSYPAYYSLYWGFDRHYYSSWHRPHFHYGVTWFPNDWFAFSAVHRYPRYSVWHPYAPYRYSAWDHRFAWHHYSPPPRYRYRAPPRYGHPTNERRMQREQFVGGNPPGTPPVAGSPRARSAVEAAAQQRAGNAAQRADYRGQSPMRQVQRAEQGTALPQGTPRMRPQAGEARAATLRDEAARMRPTATTSPLREPMQRPVQRPWQEAQATPRARAGLAPDTAPPRSIPDRRDSQLPRQTMGDPRGAPARQVTGGRMQDPRVGEAQRPRMAAPPPTQPQRMPARQAMPAQPDVRQQAPQMRQAPAAQRPAPATPRREAMPQQSGPQPRMQPPEATRAAPAPAPVRQAPARQAAPAARQAAPAPQAAPVRQAAPFRQAAPPRPSAPPQGARGRITEDREP